VAGKEHLEGLDVLLALLQDLGLDLVEVGELGHLDDLGRLNIAQGLAPLHQSDDVSLDLSRASVYVSLAPLLGSRQEEQWVLALAEAALGGSLVVDLLDELGVSLVVREYLFEDVVEVGWLEAVYGGGPGEDLGDKV